ncbi:serine/threonine-protein kinase [Nonomuraea sp. NPDC050556]|uniref:serine/threonine-protein kinase n=1 Tax=Nonomuraea sp. NPDC050556 TaxID=3364369 RepID=UPI00378BD349
MRPLRPGEPPQISHYRLTGALGTGGQGTVYQGVAPDGRKVAVKLLHARLADDPRAHRRFVAEAEAARRVALFCTASVLDVGVFHDQPYLVSEFVEGETLAALVQTQGPRAGGGLDRLAIATLTALAAIHRAGIVHRDFKPGNVLMGREGPVVIDFGIAKALDATGTATSASLGTPAYMSPEQAGGQPVGPASDVFSWAGTMVFAATGHPAFTAGTVPALLHSVLSGEPDLRGLPGAWVEPIAACLAKDPAARPTAAQLLDRLTGGEAERTIPGGRRRVNRRVLILGTAAAAVAGASAFAVLRTKETKNPEKPTPTAISKATPTPSPTHEFGDPVGELIDLGGEATYKLALSGLLAITGSSRGALAIWDLTTGELRKRLLAKGSPVTALAADRTTLASAHADGRIRIWDLGTGANSATHRASAPVFWMTLTTAVSQNYDGLKDLYGTVRFWNPLTGKPVGPQNTVHWQGADDVAFGPGIAVTGDGAEKLRVWDLETATVTRTIPTGEIGGIEHVAYAVLGGKPVAVTTHVDATLRVYDLKTGKRRGRWQFSDRSPDDRGTSALITSGSTAITAHDASGEVRVWNLRDGQDAGRITGFQGRVTALAATERVIVVATDAGKLDIRSLG